MYLYPCGAMLRRTTQRMSPVRVTTRTRIGGGESPYYGPSPPSLIGRSFWFLHSSSCSSIPGWRIFCWKHSSSNTTFHQDRADSRCYSFMSCRVHDCSLGHAYGYNATISIRMSGIHFEIDMSALNESAHRTGAGCDLPSSMRTRRTSRRRPS
jgi:hypothetical protein